MGRGPGSIELVHCGLDTTNGDCLDAIARALNGFVHQSAVLPAKRAEDVVDLPAARARPSDPDPNPAELGRSNRAHDRLQPVVAACAALSSYPDLSGFQVHVVNKYDQPVGPGRIPAKKVADSLATLVHVCTRHGQDDVSISEGRLCSADPRIDSFQFDAAPSGQLVKAPRARVVAGVAIVGPRIAQADDDQLRGRPAAGPAVSTRSSRR